MAILASVKVTKNFRITIPKEVRDYINLDENSELIFFTVPSERGRISFRKG